MKAVPPLPRIEFVSFGEIEENHPVALVTTAAAWEAVQSILNLNIAWRCDVTEATVEAWDTCMGSLQDEVIYAVGGGLAVDAAKYMAYRRGLPLVCLPTALSVDAFLTAASGIRRDECVTYIETRAPERLLVDLKIIGQAPDFIRAAGICDVLSIATACWDWQYAEQRGKNPLVMAYVPYVAQVAQGILNGALECAEAAGRGDPEGLKQLLDCLSLEVQLCNQVGHARPEEGSEHYFAYAVENRTGHGLPHGELVGPGILLMAEMQSQDVTPLRKALHACNIPLGKIQPHIVEATLRELPSFVHRHNLPFGVAHSLGGVSLEMFSKEI